MNILYFANGLSNQGGMERITVDKMNYLVEKAGYRVTVCVLNNDVHCFYPLSEKVEIVPLGGMSNQQTGIWKKIIRLLCIWKNVRKIIESDPYDVVVNVQTHIVTWILPFVCRHIPKIMEIHFSRISMACNIQDKGRLYDWIYFKVAEQVYGKYDRFVILSKTDKEYWPMKNVEVIYNFTNCCPKPVGSVQKRNVIICTARYRKQKRIDLLIQVWAKIHLRYPDWRVEVYGSGSDKALLQQMIDGEGVSDSFLLHDAVDDVMEKYAGGKIFALTSEHEGFGLVLIEAMTASLPVCAFNIVPIPEIVEDGKTGLLCDFPDVETFAGNLSRLIEDEQLRLELGKSGYERSKWFTTDIIMKQWTDLFEAVSVRS